MHRYEPPKLGDVLGQKYVLERDIGHGHFGQVFAARRVDSDRAVAVKVVHATSRNLFFTKAAVASSLSYPNTSRILDYGETDTGAFYLVMELIAGETLRTFMERNGRLTLPRALHITRQILFALSEAHVRGLVHRNIRPANVMICPLSHDREFVKVMDFGVAEMVEKPEKVLAGPGPSGEPRYWPVEQARDEPLTIGTDFYAVALVLYEMLAGAPYYRHQSTFETLIAVLQADPYPSLPTESDVPPVFFGVIRKAAAKKPEDRHQNASEFLVDLDEHFQRVEAEAAHLAARRAHAASTQPAEVPPWLRPRVPPVTEPATPTQNAAPASAQAHRESTTKPWRVIVGLQIAALVLLVLVLVLLVR